MSTPTIPLQPDVRAAYEAVFEKNQAAIETVNDFGLLKALNASQLDIGDLLSADDQFRLNADTAKFQAMLDQIDKTNSGLKDIKSKINGIADGLDKFGEVLGAITKVLSLVSAI